MALAQVLANLGLADELLQQRPVAADEAQLVTLLLQPDAAIAADQLGDVGRQIRGQRKLAVTPQDLDHLLGRVSRSRGIP